MSERTSKHVMQTYVYGNDGKFFVSTMDRFSSSPHSPDRQFSETLVWTINGGGIGRLIGEFSSNTTQDIAQHIRVCENAFRFGCKFFNKEWSDE